MKMVVWQVRLEHRYNEDYIVNEGVMEEDNLSINIFYNDEDILSTFALKITNLIIIKAQKKNIQHYEPLYVHVQLQLQKCTYNQTLIRIISTIIIAIIRAAFLLFIIVQNYKIWCRTIQGCRIAP